MPPSSILRDPLWARPFVYTHEFVPLAAAARQERRLVTIATTDFALSAISALADNQAAKLRFEVTPVDDAFQLVPIFLSALGAGRRPFPYKPPITLRRNCLFSAIADDRQLIAAANNVRIAYHGVKLYPRDQPILLARTYDQARPFTYVANFTTEDGGNGPVAANGIDISNFRVDGESDFEVQRLTALSDGPCTLQIQSAGEYWFQQELRSELIGGTSIETPDPSSGEYPYELAQAYVIQAGGYLSTFVTDVSGFANRIQVTYTGMRLSPPGGHPR